MHAIITIVSLIGWIVSGYDFATLFFYINLSIALYKGFKHFTNDKTAKR